MIDVLVADDEPLARELIKLMLSEQQDIGQIFEANDGNQVLRSVEQNKPDIVFLDIQMPGQTGLELAAKLPSDIIVIFATAFDKFAVKAFELNATGYLLKPFDGAQLDAALSKARKQIANKTPTDFKKISQLIQHMVDEQDRPYKSRLVVKDPGRIRLVDVDEINFISGAGNYAEVHLFDDKPLLYRETLTSLEKQLDPNVFVRIHRSTIVRRSSVTELRPNENGDYSVILKSGEQLMLSRRNKSKLDTLIGEQ